MAHAEGSHALFTINTMLTRRKLSKTKLADAIEQLHNATKLLEEVSNGI